jgi:hypothetical protein
MNLYVDEGYVDYDYTQSDVVVYWKEHIIFVPKIAMVEVQVDPTEIWKLDVPEFKAKLGRLQESELGMTQPTIFKHNPAVEIGGAILAKVVEILPPYVVMFEDDRYAVNLVGANNNIGDRTLVNQVSVRSSNSAGLQDLSMLQAASFDGGAVVIDTLKGIQGTVYPIGTRSNPVNNIRDANTIMSIHNLGALMVEGTLNLTGTDDVRDITILGQNPTDTFVTMTGTVLAEGVTLRNLFYSGVLSSRALLQGCILGDIEYSSGYIKECVLRAGLIKLYSDGVFINCTSGASFDAKQVIQLHQDARLTVREHHGSLKITNSDVGNLCDISLTGVITLDDTNVGGIIIVNGDATVVDNTGVNCTVIDNTGQSAGGNLDAKAVWEYPERTLTTSAGLTPEQEEQLMRAADDSTEVKQAMQGGWKKLPDGTVIFYHIDGTEFCRLRQMNSAGEVIHDGSWALLP